MNIDLGIWDRLTKVALFLLVGAGLLAVGFWYQPLIKQNESSRREVLRLEGEIAAEEATNKQLRAAIESSTDPAVIERLAREKLGYSRTNETVIRFEEPRSNSGLGH